MTIKPTLVIGEWEVDPVEGSIRRAGETRRLRPKTMDVLLCLAAHPGELVERDEIISRVWGRQLVTDEPLTTCIAELRRTLDDQAKQPLYIKTVPKRGYRLVATVTAANAPPPIEARGTAAQADAAPGSGTQRKRSIVGLAGLVAVVAVVFGWVAWQLWTDQPVPASETATDVSSDELTIAVLPFLNLSADTNYDYFGDGIAEEILNSLTKIEGLQVRSRTSSFTLKGQNLDATEIARRLRVNHILEGSVRRFGDKLRISAQLIDVNADTHVWSEVFEKTSENFFEIQGDIATQVSAALEIALDLEQRLQLGNVGTTDTGAYDLYLRGRQLLARRTFASVSTASETFARALQLDPNYAQAYLGVADANLLLPLYNDRPGTRYLEKALEAVEQALLIAPELGEAYATLGSVRHEMGEFAAAEQAFRIALERAPRYPTTYHWYGFMLYDMARQQEADEMLRFAAENHPLSNLLSYAYSANLVAMRRFDEAETRYREIIDTDPEFAWAYEGLGELNWNGRGRLDAAAKAYELAVRYDPDSAYFPALLGAIYLDMGKPETAKQWINRAARIQPQSFIARIHLALLHLFNGDDATAHELALEILEHDPRNFLALTIVRSQDFAAGRLPAAREHYARGFPELLDEDPPLDVGNFQAATDLALILLQLGETEQAAVLLERSWNIAESYPRAGLPYRLSDVKILVGRGNHDEALAVLKRSIEGGWRPYWWLFMKHDPALESVRKDIRFRQLIEKLQANGSQ